MNTVGLFEAKTKFSDICARVADKGESIVVTRCGKPLVRIDPIPVAQANPVSVWDRRADYERKHGHLAKDFNLPPREKQTWCTPLDE
jgi:prevent-host-death family protein